METNYTRMAMRLFYNAYFMLTNLVFDYNYWNNPDNMHFLISGSVEPFFRGNANEAEDSIQTVARNLGVKVEKVPYENGVYEKYQYKIVTSEDYALKALEKSFAE